MVPAVKPLEARRLFRHLRMNFITRMLLRERLLKEQGVQGSAKRGLCRYLSQGIFLSESFPEDVPDIVARTVLKGEIIDDLVYVDPQTHQKASLEKEVPFYKDRLESFWLKTAVLTPPAGKTTFQPTGMQGWLRFSPE